MGKVVDSDYKDMNLVDSIQIKSLLFTPLSYMLKAMYVILCDVTLLCVECCREL